MLILHVENVIELSIGNMIDTRSHEWVKLNVAFGFVRGGKPVFSTGDKQCREDGGLHERFPVRCLVAYLLAADNVSEPLSTRLRGVNQTVIRTQNAFSTLLSRLLADI